jgi:hypothetical protein
MKMTALLALFLMRSASLGQSIQTPVTVMLTNENLQRTEVFDALAARIRASSRYRDTFPAIVWVDVNCMTLEQFLEGSHPEMRDQFVCNMDVTYRDPSMLSNDLYSGIVRGHSVSAAEGLFEAFVNNTTDGKIAAAIKSIRDEVKYYCTFHANPAECQAK